MMGKQNKIKKFLQSVFALSLCATVVVSSAACSKGGEGGSSLGGNSSGGGDGGNGGNSTSSSITDVQETTLDLVKNNQSDYVVVVPANPNTAIQFAADELTTFFEEATGYALPVKYDSGYAYNENQKIISIGETKPFIQSGVTLDFNEFYEDGAYLDTQGSQVFLCGARDSGTINAVYDFLQLHFNFEVYASDEVYIDQVSDKKLLEFDEIKDIPAVRSRAGGGTALNGDPVYCTRMRRNRNNGGYRYGSNDPEYVTLAHTVQYIVKEATYGESNPDWFGTSGHVALGMYFQDPEFKKVVLDYVKDGILSKPDATAYQFGMNDNMGNCKNAATKEWVEERGGPSGALVAFANGVSRDILAWLREINDPRADIFRFSILAYIAYESAPVTFNDETQKYEPVHPDVVADDNISVMICGYYAQNQYSLLHSRNNRYKNCLQQWSVLAKHLEVWYYPTNYSCYMVPYNNIAATKENAQIFREYNVSYIMDNGIHNTSGTPFLLMRNYLFSKLWWNPDLDMRELIENYIYYYYKDAAPYIQEYFDMIQMNYAALDVQYREDNKWLPSGMYETDIQAGTKVWSEGFTNKANELLKKAEEAASKMVNVAEREKVLFRVKCESLTPRFFLLDLHSSTLSIADCAAAIDAFEADAAECGLQKPKETGNIATVIEEWRTNLAALEG